MQAGSPGFRPAGSLGARQTGSPSAGIRTCAGLRPTRSATAVTTGSCIGPFKSAERPSMAALSGEPSGEYAVMWTSRAAQNARRWSFRQ
eukprot:361082-Chlamydomonas_euryale.AAC.12